MCWNPHTSLDGPHAVCDFPHPCVCSSFCHPPLPSGVCCSSQCPPSAVWARGNDPAPGAWYPQLPAAQQAVAEQSRSLCSSPAFSGALCGSLCQSAGNLHWTLVSSWPIPSVKPDQSFPAQKLPGRTGRRQRSRKQFLGLFELIVLMAVIEWEPGTR